MPSANHCPFFSEKPTREGIAFTIVNLLYYRFPLFLLAHPWVDIGFL
jgi:hypothetical protein